MPTRSPSSRSRFSLVALVALASLLELVLNRVVARMLHRELLAPQGWLRNTVDVAGLFAFYFSAALAVLVATYALVTFLLSPTAVPRGARGAMSALAVAFVPLALIGVWLRLPPALDFYLAATFTALVLLLALGGLLTSAQARQKAGLLALAVPVVVHFVVKLAANRTGPFSSLTQGILLAGEASVALVGVASVFLLAPARPRLLVGAVVGVLVTSFTATFVVLDGGMASLVAAYGFGVELPVSTPAAMGYVMAFGAWSGLVASLVASPGSERLRGWGLLLIGLSGFQLETAGQVATTLTGVLCVLASLERRQAVDVNAWRQVVQRAAAAVGALTVNAVGEPGREEAQLRVVRQGETVEVTLGARDGRVTLVEAVCGVAPANEPAPLSLTRRGTERLGRSEGLLVETGDVVFDEIFRVRDARELHGEDAILSDNVRPRLLALVEGWLGVWPSRGVRYRAQRPPLLDQLHANDPQAGVRLAQLVELLAELKRA